MLGAQWLASRCGWFLFQLVTQHIREAKDDEAATRCILDSAGVLNCCRDQTLLRQEAAAELSP